MRARFGPLVMRRLPCLVLHASCEIRLISACAISPQVAPSLAINYCAYETLRSYWLSFQPELKAPTVAMSLLCGSFAGLISSTATFPLDLARRRLQLEGQVRFCLL